jgi:hypothetical protein
MSKKLKLIPITILEFRLLKLRSLFEYWKLGFCAYDVLSKVTYK